MPDPAVTPVHAFADRAWEQYLELNPLWATAQGDERWDDRLDDPGPAGRAAGLVLVDAWEAEIDGFAVVALLRRLCTSPLVKLKEKQQADLQADLKKVEQSCFGATATALSESDLRTVATKWLKTAT